MATGVEQHVCQFDEIISILEPKSTKVAILTHRHPDPDAMGSMIGISWALKKKYSIDADTFYDGAISNPQNVAVMKLLDISLRDISTLNSQDYNFYILVDAVPQNAGEGDKQLSYNMVIDHHKEVPNNGFAGLFLNIHAGSCCGTIFNIIEGLQIPFEKENDADVKVATALLAGVITDTDNFISDDTTDYEFDTYRKLFDIRDPDALRRIIKYKLPFSWLGIKGKSCINCELKQGVAVVGVGLLEDKQRDVIANIADDLIRTEGVETCVVFAVIDTSRIDGAVRSNSASIDLSALCKLLAGKYGSGGAKLSAGGYRIPLSGSGCDAEDSEETRKILWDFLSRKEKDKIFRLTTGK